MRQVRQVLSYPAAVANSVALSQTTAGAGPLTLNGALVIAGVATLSGPNALQAQLTLASGGNDSAVNFVITGTDYRGSVVTETLAGPSGNTVTSVNSYATVTSIVASAAVGQAITAGNAQAGSSPVIVFDQYISPFQISLSLGVVGTVNVTVQYTNDPIFGTTSLDALNWFNFSSLTNQTGNQMGSLVSPVTAARLVWVSGSGTVTYTATQSGNGI